MYKTRQKIGREQRRNVLFLPLSLLSKFHDLNMNKAFYLSQPLLSFTEAVPVYVLIHILPNFLQAHLERIHNNLQIAAIQTNA